MFITGSVRNYALRWPETRSSRAAKNHTSTTTSTSTTTPVNSTTSPPVPLPASRRRTSRLPRQGPPTHPQNPHAAAPLTPHAAVSLTRSRRNSITLSVQIGDGTLSFHPPSPLLFSLPLSSTFPHFSLTIKISSLGREGPIGHIAAKGYGERLFLRSPLATVFLLHCKLKIMPMVTVLRRVSSLMRCIPPPTCLGSAGERCKTLWPIGPTRTTFHRVPGLPAQLNL